MIEPNRDQGTLAAREASILMVLPALGRLEPGVSVASQDRSCPRDRQLPEAAHVGEIAAESRVARDKRTALVEPLAVAVEQPCPYVSGRAQQPITAGSLASCQAQPDHGSPVHQGGRIADRHIELMFDSCDDLVKPGPMARGSAEGLVATRWREIAAPPMLV